MSQANPVDHTEPDDDLINSLLSSISALLPAGKTSNDYVNDILKIIREMRLPCTIYSVVPWEFNCTRIERY
ncbi:unnamed protein product [Lasius platythorax]